jgi:hypothetical protein
MVNAMKVRLDLLEFLTPEDVLETALSEIHRYKPEPNFAKTGVGFLAPATPEDIEREIRESEKLAKRLKERARVKKEREAKGE